MLTGRTVGVVALALVVAGVAGGVASAQTQTGAIPIDSCRTIADDGRYVLTTDIENSSENTCIHIISGDVVFDGQGHTIEGENTAESVGIRVNNSLTTLSNVTVTNVSTTGWATGIYYLDTNNGTIKNVTASANRKHGIRLRTAKDIRLANVTAANNGRWSLYAIGNATNVTGVNFETQSATVSFTASNVALTGVSSPGSPPNRTTIGQHVGVGTVNQNASLRLAVNYTTQNVTSANVTERTLRMWVYDGNWSKPSDVNLVNVTRNRVVVNVSSLQNASTFAPAGVVRTPTPTAIQTAMATATPETTDAADTTGASTQTTTTSSGDGPGFGIALALVSLLAGSLVAFGRR